MGGRGSSLIASHMANNDNKFVDVQVADDPESELHTDIFKELKQNNISTRESTDGIDDIILQRQQKRILEISKNYRNILKNSTKDEDIHLCAENMQGTTLGYCELTINGDGQVRQRVALDSKQMKNYDKVVETVTKAVYNGQFVPINIMFKSRDYIVTHEFGHAIENSIIVKARNKNKNNNDNLTLFVPNMQEKIFCDVVKIWKEKFATGEKDDTIYLSKYSRNSPVEWFAETFTNMELADNPAPIAQALKEYLRREGL